MTEPMYTVPEALERLSVSKTTLYGLLRRGELPRVKVGGRTYVPAAELTTYLEGLCAASHEAPTAVRHSPRCSYLVFHNRPCDCPALAGSVHHQARAGQPPVDDDGPEAARHLQRPAQGE